MEVLVTIHHHEVTYIITFIHPWKNCLTIYWFYPEDHCIILYINTKEENYKAFQVQKMENVQVIVVGSVL